MTRRYGMVVMCLALAGIPVFAQAPEQGFTQLFNGKDLTGWVYGSRANGAENKTGKGYQVENGVLFTTKEDGGNLYTEKEYCGLRPPLRLQADREREQRHRHPRAARRRRRLRRDGDPGARRRRVAVHEPQARAVPRLDLQMFPAKRGHQKPVGEWNTQEITVKGRQITVKLNGVTIADANLDDVKDEELLRTHRDMSKPEGSRGIANTKGHIGFLGHGARVEFRNIRIKEL